MISMIDRYDSGVVMASRNWEAHVYFCWGNELCNYGSASPAGVETLKNLVLPGIGHFTVVDTKTIDSSDINSNFFTRTLGRPRAQEVLELLGELNPDVSGDYDSTRDLVGYDLVVANELPMKECLELSRSADVA